MKREDKLMHDDGSCTMEGDGTREHLQHDWDHRHGKGDDDEHTEQYGHEALHNVPHNSSPVRSNLIDDVKDAWNKRKVVKSGPITPLSSIPEKYPKPEPM